MGIDRTGPVGPLHPAGETPGRTARREAREAGSDRPAHAPRGDEIEISEAARRLNQAAEPSREAMVERLRSEVESGTYRVEAEAVARELVERGEA